jgi:hypothetical protein
MSGPAGGRPVGAAPAGVKSASVSTDTFPSVQDDVIGVITLPPLDSPPPAGPAAGPARALFARLSADPRLPAWLWRTGASVLVGLVLAVAVDWRLGIAGAALTGAIGTLYGIRTSAVVPASARDASARRRTRHRLGRLAPAGYLTHTGRLIPDTGSVTEHLLVGPAGVFAIASVHWDRRLPVRASRGGRLYHGPFEETGRLERLRRQAEQGTKRLHDALGPPAALRPVLLIYGPQMPWPLMTLAGVDVLPGNRLRGYLRRELSERRGGRLTERQIEVIHAVAAQMFPPAG